MAGVGIEPEDEVIVPAYTFIASAMAVLHHNAIPVFADIDPETYLLDPVSLQEEISERTKAIMAVHIHGLPADMDPIREIATENKLKVIEDAAQAFGALYGSKKTGTLGDAAAFAMTTTKQLMTGEGGLLTTDNPEVYERAAMTRLIGERGDMKSIERDYMSECVGWNYKMAKMISALARVRLRHLDHYLQGARQLAAHLTYRLSSVKGLQPPVAPSNRTHTYYLYTLQLRPEALNQKAEPGKVRDAVVRALRAEQIDVMRWQKVPIPAQPIFQHKHAYGKGCPWQDHDSPVRYDLDQYPNTWAALERSFVIWRVVAPNGLELMDVFAEAIQKVMSQIDRVVELFDRSEEYLPLKKRMARLSGRGE